MKVRIGCDEASRLLSASQDRPLPAAERTRLRLHLVLCDACRNVELQLALLRRVMRRLGPDEPPAD